MKKKNKPIRKQTGLMENTISTTGINFVGFKEWGVPISGPTISDMKITVKTLAFLYSKS